MEILVEVHIKSSTGIIHGGTREGDLYQAICNSANGPSYFSGWLKSWEETDEEITCKNCKKILGELKKVPDFIMKMYHVVKSVTRLFDGDQNLFLFAENDEKAIQYLIDYLRNEVDELDDISLREEKGDAGLDYVSTIIVTRITNEWEDIISGIEVNDFYHIYRIGVPEPGIIYPEIGD